MSGLNFFRSSLRALCLVALALAVLAPAAPAWSADDYVPTVLITGANRGIGLEYVRQYAARGWTVVATARKPDEATELQELAKANPRVIIETLDVSDLASIDALAQRWQGKPVDILINNAGITGDAQAQLFPRWTSPCSSRCCAPT